MAGRVSPEVLARAVTAVSQALVERRGHRADLEQRYVFTLEAALTHGLREGVWGLLSGHTRLFDVFAATVQAFPKAERGDAEHVFAAARYYGDKSLGRARILLRLLLNQGVLPAWLSCLCFNLALLERYYEPWALFRTPPAAAQLCAAVDAATRAVRFALAFDDALLNEPDYWDAHPRIVALDVPLAVAPRPPAFTGKRLPLAVAPADTPHLAACQALLRARAAVPRLAAALADAARTQAQGLVATRLVCGPARPALFPQQRAAAQHAQALLAAARDSAAFHGALGAAAAAQALLRTRVAARQHGAWTAAAQQTQALVAQTLVRDAGARVRGAQALVVAHVQQSRHAHDTDAVAQAQALLCANAAVRGYSETGEAACAAEALVRGARTATAFVRGFVCAAQHAQGLLAARGRTPYGTACAAASACAALVRAQQQTRVHARVQAAAAALQALVRADTAVRAHRRRVHATALVQGVVRSNAHALMHLLRVLAAAWAQSGLATRRCEGTYARARAAQHAQALLRGTRVRTRFVAAQRRLQHEHARQQAALRAAQELRVPPQQPPLQQQQQPLQQSPQSPQKPQPQQQQQQQQVLYAQPLTPARTLPAAAGRGAGSPGGRRPQWVPDSASAVCMLCRRPFTVTNRKHHCRYCGLLVDGQCTEKRALPQLGYPEPVIVCRSCVVRHFT